MVWSIRNKLASIGILALIGIIAVLTPTFMAATDIANAIYANEKRGQDVNKLSEVNDVLERFHEHATDAIMDAFTPLLAANSGTHKAPEVAQTIALLHDDAAKLRATASVIKEIAESAAERTISNDYASNIEALARLADTGLPEALRSGNPQAIFAVDDAQLDPLSGAVHHDLEAITESVNSKAEESYGLLMGTIDGTRGTLITSAIISTSILIIALFQIIRSITRPLSALSGGMRQVVEGQGANAAAGRDELGEMVDALQVVSNIIASSMADIRGAMSSQSAAASEQASAVNETTSTLSEIKATSRQTLEKTLSQGEKAETARMESDRGNQAVSRAIEGMAKIHQKVEDVASSILDLSKKTQQIGDITEVVDDLARQSKMLAFNASIEAAKAGEAGQGFAVVAEEIRSLAEQSRESTAQVRAILQDIQSSSDHTVMVAEEGTKEVAIGSQLVDDAGKVIAALGTVVQQTAFDSQQITAAVRQESAGIDQIVEAMHDISTAARNSASSVRQTEAAIDELSRIAERLKEQVSAHRI